MDNELLKQVTEKAEKWLSPEYDEETRAAVKAMLDSEDKTELIESFYKDLEFGTGGLRGIMGAGSNRMNIYTVGAATQGLSNYLKVAFKDLPEIKVVVGHDVRNNSRKFAEIVADIFSANGIKVYLFDSCRPTPEMSFAIRHFGCQSGVIITASHNPKEYNGYKAYWDDGAQMIAPHDVNTIKYVNEVTDVADIKFKGDPSKIEIIGEEVDKIFLEKVKSLSLSPEAIKRHHDMKIVYTPLHGTGEMLARRALAQAGFEAVQVVEAQAVPDADFSTVKSPNPENQAAFALAEELGRKVDADVLVATDPDADRLGVEIRQPDGSYLNLSGNQIGAIIAKYILEAHKTAGTLPANAALCKSIVSTELVTKIAESYGATMFNVLTGFKFIGEKIHEFETQHNHTYMLGFEESFGYLIKPFVRDKDAIQAVLIVAEIAAYYRSRGMTLADGIEEIYKQYGYFAEKTISVTLSGVDGAAEIKKIMDKFRGNAPKQFNNTDIAKTEDFLEQTATTADGVEKLTTPPSNVLKYILADDSWFAVRPSGTEPKIKFYIATVGESEADAKEKIANIEAEINAFVGE